MTEFSILRQQAGLSVAQVAEQAGYDERTAYRWESGESKPRASVIKLLRSLQPQPRDLPTGPKFRFVDLFAGIGGLRRGFETIGGKCVFTSEWDRWAVLTYRANYPTDDHAVAGDIRAVPEHAIPEHDVLLAGFPCQPFSVAGVSKKNALNRPHGFADDTQGTLFFDVARILAKHRPAAFLLENVKNLLSHDKRRTFEVIRRVLEKDLGYHVQFRLIDGRAWTPQHRERIYIVGFRDPSAFEFDTMPVPKKRPKLSSVLHGHASSEVEPPYTGPKGHAAPKYTLSQHLWGYLQNYAEKHREKGNGFGFGLVGEDDVARTLSARYFKDGSEILIRQTRKPPRRLTPRECARLMGFDAPGRPPMKIPVSDTQAYKQFGNAVVVPVVEAIAAHMAPHIEAALIADGKEVSAVGLSA